MPWNEITTKVTGNLVTAVEWNAIDQNMDYLERISYTAFTSALSVTATTSATAQTVVTAPAFTAEAVPHRIEFYAPSLRPSTAAGDSIHLHLYDGSTQLGRIAFARTPAAGTQWSQVASAPIYLTPTAASHTYSVRAHVNAGTGSVEGGTGVADAYWPGYLAIYRVPT